MDHLPLFERTKAGRCRIRRPFVRSYVAILGVQYLRCLNAIGRLSRMPSGERMPGWERQWEYWLGIKGYLTQQIKEAGNVMGVRDVQIADALLATVGDQLAAGETSDFGHPVEIPSHVPQIATGTACDAAAQGGTVRGASRRGRKAASGG